MGSYLGELKRYEEQHKAQRTAKAEADRAAASDAARARLSPLEDRLARLLATIPIEVQRDGLSLTSLQAGLRGRWRGSCHPGELGTALRKLGFERKRVWRPGSADGFKATWFQSL